MVFFSAFSHQWTKDLCLQHLNGESRGWKSSVCVCPMVVWMPVWKPSRHHFFKDLLFVLKLGPFRQGFLDFLSWFSSDCGCMELLLETAPGHPKFLVTLKATTIYFAEWFIISASLFPWSQEQIHLSPLSADHHSLAAAPSLVSSTQFFLSCSPAPVRIPPEDQCHHLFPLFLLWFHPPLLSSFPRWSCQQCGLKQMCLVFLWNVLLLSCGNDITLKPAHMFVLYVPESKQLLMSSKCEWNELLLTFNPFHLFYSQVDPRHKALWKHSYSRHCATKVSLILAFVDLHVLCYTCVPTLLQI